ncbi:MAG TPA: DUF2163 domain-containing protein [Pyrinomonadaceae bacterium]|jgi:uncharacterized phage protein (TIGR02218 family)|nr:DUF2163 domain-containing protein [Pyrinomonadaceae bacterium]
MPVTATQKDLLKSNCTFVCQIWKMTTKDGLTVAFCSHTRKLIVGSVTYLPASPFDPARVSAKVGLKPDSAETVGVLDDVVTEADIQGGRWSGARIYTAFVVDYRDTSQGVVAERNGFVGKISIRGEQYTFEFLSLSQALSQQIGEVTSPTDRNRKPEDLGVSMAAFTFAATVTSVTDRSTFAVGLSPAKADHYFQYGRAEWQTGANAGLKMEVKDNTGNAITLTLPMRSNIATGDTLYLIAGYDGSREAARDKFAAAINFNGEPDLPGMNKVLKYPD